MAQFNLLVRAASMLDYLLIISNKAPKSIRNGFIAQINKAGCNTLEYIIMANNYPLDKNSPDYFQKRQEYQIKAKASIQIVDNLAEVGLHRGYFTNHQLETLTNYTKECQATLVKWMESDVIRFRK